MSVKPLVSIIIPCKEIDEYTKESIAGCKQLDYENFEIIVLPDFQSDALEGIKLIPTGAVSPGVKRNSGIEHSTGEFCAFIDNDAYPRRDWLINALKILSDPLVGGVGGPGLTPPEDNLRQKAGGYVLSSFMVGCLSNRYKTTNSVESDDIHSCNFIARRSVLIIAGGWNEKYWPGEDTLMCLAIKKTGKKLIDSSEVVVYHHRRALFKSHLKQVSRFGQHRGLFVKKFPENSVKVTYFVPSLIVSLFFAGLLFSLFNPFFLSIFLFGLTAYLIASFIAAVLQVKRSKLLFTVWLGIIVTHIVYGLFFLSGLLKRDLKR
ncbi:MAG: glycosyltransferase [Nitrososphaerota archaeon]|jgi:cellulose synthase/poly-beta-1,6-N-acetylglucosamine synthase-like glycosyltransferase|nr:glycosyltransferase [Nitrososphaerota archaeon]